MAKYKIAWLPGDGIGVDVLEAARMVLDRVELDAEYIDGDIGWEFWRREGDAFPQRTIDLLGRVDAALFGAITSTPVKAPEAGRAPFGFARAQKRRKVPFILYPDDVRAADGVFPEGGRVVAHPFPEIEADE